MRAALLLIALQCAAPAWANMGKPWREGPLVAEPQGFEAVRIVHEDLRIDLSDLADGASSATVRVSYKLDNGGQPVRLRPVFATGASGAEGFEARLDGRTVAARPAQPAALPKPWQPPATTPALSGEQPLSYEVDQPSNLVLDFVLPPGQHDFSVSYRAEAMLSKREGPTLLYQFAYVLAPARSWADFGGLDVQVSVPEGWRFAAAPALRKDERDDDPRRDVYRGRYPGLPGDAIAITTQAAPGLGYSALSLATQLWLGLAVFGGGLACRPIAASDARRAGRDGATGAGRKRRVWPYALAAGLAWGSAVACAGLAALYAPEHLLPDGQGYSYGYGRPLAAIAVVMLAALLSLIGFIAVAAIARRRLRQAGSGTVGA